MEKLKVVSIHFGNKCSRLTRCKWCYTANKSSANLKDIDFFIKLVPYLKDITEQVAIGSYGEPLLYPEFIIKFSEACKNNGLICNLTTNGDLVRKVDPKVFRNINMISLSFNEELMKTPADLKNFARNVNYLNCLGGYNVGVNLLVNKPLFIFKNAFIKLVSKMFNNGVKNVYALYPKNYKLGIDITKHKVDYYYLTDKFDGFVVDDLTKEILEQGYSNWSKPCHFCKDLISISPEGKIFGCSFDSEPILVLNKPEDIKQLKVNGDRYICPYLMAEG